MDSCWDGGNRTDVVLDLYGTGCLTYLWSTNRFLISLCKYIHMTFVGIYLQDEAVSFSPFDDISYYHATPSVGLAVEEIFEVHMYEHPTHIYHISIVDTSAFLSDCGVDINWCHLPHVCRTGH